MKKLYAIFKKEEDAQTAIDRLSFEGKNIEAEFISGTSAPIDRDIFKFDADIIGSPLPMASQFDINGYENTNIAPAYAGLSAFCYADFVATSKNSLAASQKHLLPIDDDVYNAAVALKIPADMQDTAANILTEAGGSIIN